MVSFLAIFGCSSGGGDAGVTAPLYSGATTPAAITQGNADEIARTSSEGINEAVNLTAPGDAFSALGLPSAIATRPSTDALAQKISEVVFNVLDSAAPIALPSAAVVTSDDLNGGASGPFCGGNFVFPDNFDETATNLDVTMSFNELCFTDGITTMRLNGSLRFQKTDTSISMSFTNFSVTVDGTRESFSGVFSCDTDIGNCSIATDYVGSDGHTYRLADVLIDTTSGYDVSATFYHYELGKVTITTQLPVSYGDCGIYPSTGIIDVLSDDGSNITVSFIGCTYSITGIDANSSSISFSGSWN